MKIAFCDLEGSLIETGNWEKIAVAFGNSEWYSRFLEKYNEGKIGFEEGRRDLEKIWKEKKITKQQFIDALKDYKLIEGVRELIVELKNRGFRIVLLTGAISVLAELVKEDLGIDEVYCGHEFIFDSDGVFVEIKEHPEYRRGEGKVHFIKEVISKEGVKKEDCIAIGGDDINDYWMMKELRSFAVKPHLRQMQEVVDHNVEKLTDILKFV